MAPLPERAPSIAPAARLSGGWPAELERSTSGVRRGEVLSVRDGAASFTHDWLAEEVPVALVFNGISHAVMLATPDDLEDFAFGFAMTEGLLQEVGELRGVDVVEVADGIEVHLEVSSECEWRLKERRRNLAGRTGCGLCGTDSLSMVRRSLPCLSPMQLSESAVVAAMRSMRTWQPRLQLTGATHAAALCHLDGEIELVREDVGRHNALDKLIGACLRERRDTRDRFLAITSRASFEMVQKAACAGIPALAAISAPTAMAVDLALQSNVLLVGFARAGGMVAYTFPERLSLDPGVGALALKGEA